MPCKNSGRNPDVLQWVHPQHGPCSATDRRGRAPRRCAGWKEPISGDCAGEDCIYMRLLKRQHCADGGQMSRCQRPVGEKGGAVRCKRGRSLWQRCWVRIMTVPNSSARAIKVHGTKLKLNEMDSLTILSASCCDTVPQLCMLLPLE